MRCILGDAYVGNIGFDHWKRSNSQQGSYDQLEHQSPAIQSIPPS